VSEFASLTSQDHGLSLSSELFDGQLDSTTSVKQEQDVLDSLNIDAFDLAGFANANTACGTTTMFSQNVLNQSSSFLNQSSTLLNHSSVVKSEAVQNVAGNQSGAQLQFVLQQPQLSVPQNPTSTISVTDLLRAQEIVSTGGGTALQLPATPEVSTVPQPTLDLSSPVTLELLAQAGIQQPVKRQIQLHSELAQHITTTQKPLQVTTTTIKFYFNSQYYC